MRTYRHLEAEVRSCSTLLDVEKLARVKLCQMEGIKFSSWKRPTGANEINGSRKSEQRVVIYII